MEGATQNNKKELRTILDSNEVQNYFQIQNVQIKEEVVSDDEPAVDLQPVSQVFLQEYQIKSEVVDSTTLAGVEQLEDKHEDTKKLFSCSLCKKNNMILKYFKVHLTKKHHLSKDEVLKYVPEFYECKYCHRQFETPFRLHEHEGSHTLPFKCDVCYKSFGLKSNFKRHKLTHTEPQFPCPHCDMKFRRKSQLTDHLGSLHSGVVHKCDQCEMKFKCRKYLLHHIRNHNNTTHQICWECDECGKGFKFKPNLKRHIIVGHHTMSKNYLCSYCNLKFKSNYNLKVHIKTIHNRGDPIESNKWAVKPRTYSKASNSVNAKGVSKPVGQLLKLQKQPIKEEISEDAGPEIQPISEVYLPEWQEGNIKTEVNSPLESTMTVEQHEDKHEDTKTLFSCSLCKKNNMVLSSFKQHLIQLHQLSKEEILKYVPEFYQCKYCHRHFKTPSRLHLHEGSHTLPYKCDNVQIKEEVVSDDKPAENLQPISQVYLQEYHQLKSEVVDSTALAGVEQHEDKQEDTKKLFSCSLCKKNNLSLLSFKLHLINAHHLNKEEILKYVPEFYQCKYCHRQFKTPFKLQKHEGSHTVPFKCDICYKSFSLKSTLKRHKLTHSEPQIPCPHCDATFRRKDNLTNHIESLHSGVVHECAQCEKKFKWRSCLLTHIRNHHSGITHQSCWECDDCGKCFKMKRYIRRHIIAVHVTLSKNYLCSYCSVKFKSNDDLKVHIKTIHNRGGPIESNKWSVNQSTSCNNVNSNGPVGLLLILPNRHIKEEISEDDVSEFKPISEVYLPEYKEENIKT